MRPETRGKTTDSWSAESRLWTVFRGIRHPWPQSQPEELSQPLSLRPADGDFHLLFVIHAELVGALEPGDDFLNTIDIDQVGAVRPPKQIGIQAVQQFFERTAIRLPFHAVGAAGNYCDDAVLDRCIADVALTDEK